RIAGSATLSTEPSTKLRLEARMHATRVQRGSAPALLAVWLSRGLNRRFARARPRPCYATSRHRRPPPSLRPARASCGAPPRPRRYARARPCRPCRRPRGRCRWRCCSAPRRRAPAQCVRPAGGWIRAYLPPFVRITRRPPFGSVSRQFVEVSRVEPRIRTVTVGARLFGREGQAEQCQDDERHGNAVDDRKRSDG